MNSQEIRRQFIQFFEGKGHTFAKPSPVIPQNDPTLLFINAGMNQFKDEFLGQGWRPYTRAVNSQPCIRVSGKHNDLEDVGRDVSHLTSFEMLGNWSFGDFYKREAISWAWEYLTDVCKLPKDKLYVTIYETDDEAELEWQTQTDIPHDRILRFDKKDNFWEMGDTGPCGPCSEIHIDLGPECCDRKGVEHDCWVNGTCNRYLELWNLVFIQYNRGEDGTLEDLPAKHVDTGMGLERLVGYLNGSSSAYMTDLLHPIIARIEALTGVAYEDTLDGMPHRVMADHIRTVTFAISDNAMPSNEGRGYVLRRLIRRALRYAQKLGVNEPIMYKLVDEVNTIMGGYLDNIPQRLDFIKHMVKAEEESFLRTLSTGIVRFDDIVAALQAQGHTEVSGDDAFKLYDTYGFPVDLTQVMAEELGLTVDMSGFEAALAHQKAQSREAGKSHLAGQLAAQSQQAEQGDYEDVVHRGVYVDAPGGGEARLVYTPEDQLNMARHHTGTHLLHEALRHTLGDHVQQAGSLVDLDHLRFDFSHYHAVTDEQLAALEQQVNDTINENLAIEILQTTLDEAKAMGATALFGEKYEDDNVRVVKIGEYSTELCGGNHAYSTGPLERIKITHESATSAGTRRIEAVLGHENIRRYDDQQADVIRRRLTGRVAKIQGMVAALAAYDAPTVDRALFELDALDADGLKARERELVEQLKTLEKALAQAKDKAAGSQTGVLLEQLHALGSQWKYVIYQSDELDLQGLRSLSDNLVNAEPSSVAVLLSTKTGACAALVRTPEADFPLTAQEVFTQLTQVAGGKGGGRGHMAQGGGLDPAKVSEAVEAVEAFLKRQVT